MVEIIFEASCYIIGVVFPAIVTERVILIRISRILVSGNQITSGYAEGED